MEKSISKYLTISFAAFAGVIAFSLSLLLKAFAGAFSSFAFLMGYDLFKHGLPIVVGLVLFLSLQFNARVLGWGYEVFIELERVIWPAKKDVRLMTWAVLVMVTLITLVIAFLDFISAALMKLILG